MRRRRAHATPGAAPARWPGTAFFWTSAASRRRIGIDSVWLAPRWVAPGCPRNRRPSATVAASHVGPRQSVSGGPQHVNEPLGGVRRIAVLRCNALGDYLMATPALTALRQ